MEIDCITVNYYLHGRCFYCGVKTKKMRPGAGQQKHQPAHMRTMDHVIPRSKGGRGVGVKVTCCWKCNHYKSDLDLEEYRAKVSAERGGILVIFFGEKLTSTLDIAT
jgi:5-methylcytosine-specific restriction endonuclease McrA